jgi:hypothetical protein
LSVCAIANCFRQRLSREQQRKTENLKRSKIVKQKKKQKTENRMQKCIKTIVANEVLFEDLKSLNVVLQHDERQHKTLVSLQIYPGKKTFQIPTIAMLTC